MANRCAEEAISVPNAERSATSGVGVYRTGIPGLGEGDYVVRMQLPGPHHAVVVVGNVIEVQQPRQLGRSGTCPAWNRGASVASPARLKRTDSLIKLSRPS